MPNFHYIQGKGELAEIKNAIGYELAIKNANNTYTEVARRYKRQSLNIPGAIWNDGMLYLEPRRCNKGATLSVLPLTKYTGDGSVHYVKVSGSMTVEMVTSSNAIIPIPDKIYGAAFEGIYYLDSYAPITFSYGSLSIGTDGVYLEVKSSTLGNTYDRIKVYDLSAMEKDNIKNIYMDKTYVTVTGVYNNVYRSSFIPLPVLTDDLNGSCFGYFHNYATDAAEGTYIKLAFYKSPSYSTDSFIAGFTGADIKTKFGEEKNYLTTTEIRTLASELAGIKFVGLAPGSPDEKYADINNWFVVFCSRRDEAVPAAGTDVVSIGKVFFPLFENDYATLKGAGTYNLAVRAIGDGTFFSDSEYSGTISYTKATS